MNRYILLLTSVAPFLTLAQIEFGVGGYIEYHKGNIPLIISVPHGGNLTPDSIPDRNCAGSVWTTDMNTIELAREIQDAFVSRTGCTPHTIYSHLHRKKIDLNRNQADATCNHTQLIPVFSDFHGFIDASRELAIEEFGFAFYLDLHGHGNEIQRIELGYLLYEEELEESDDILNTPQFISYSSIQLLAQSHHLGFTHAEILRGSQSLGNLLEMNHFATVPSVDQPAPGIGNNYFSGGFNTRFHTGFSSGIQSDGVQMECNYTGVRDTEENRRQFAVEFVDAMLTFLEIHYAYQTSNCSLTASAEITENIVLYPNPAHSGERVKLTGGIESGELTLFDYLGRKIQLMIDSGENEFYLPHDLSAGYYYIEWTDANQRRQLPLIID